MNKKVLFIALLVLVGIFVLLKVTNGNRPQSSDPLLIVEASPEDITRIEYISGDATDVFVRELDGTWYYAGMAEVDSSDMAGYLEGLNQLSARELGAAPVGYQMSRSLRLSGNNMEPIELSLFRVADEKMPFTITSSVDPDAYFKSDSSGIFDKLFGNLDALLLKL